MINIIIIFLLTHNITSTQNKQNNRHSTPQKSSQKEEREGGKKEKKQNKSFIYIVMYVKEKKKKHCECSVTNRQPTRRWRNPVPHIKYASCIRAQKIDPRCKYSNTWARLTAESKPFTFSDKIFRACIEYS